MDAFLHWWNSPMKVWELLVVIGVTAAIMVPVIRSILRW